LPQFRQYPQANSIISTDAFLIDRIGIGTMYIEAQNMPFSSNPAYDIAMNVEGSIPTSVPLFVFNAVRSYSIPTNAAGSKFTVQTAPSASFALTVNHNSSPVGSITFAANSNVGTATMTNTSFVSGDELIVYTPSDVHGAQTLAITFAGSKS